MSRIIRVIVQNSSYQNINKEEVKNKEVRYLPDLSIFNLLYIGEVEAPYSGIILQWYRVNKRCRLTASHIGSGSQISLLYNTVQHSAENLSVSLRNLRSRVSFVIGTEVFRSLKFVDIWWDIFEWKKSKFWRNHCSCVAWKVERKLRFFSPRK